MNRINLKPISVNECWQGRRFKTKGYDVFEATMLLLMPKIYLPAKPYHVSFRFGLSSPHADIDNPIKPTLDLLQKKYGFNDRDVNAIYAEKIKTEKGKEFIEFEISSYESTH